MSTVATEFDFTHYLRVRFSECDPQNVVFNARYAEYVDVAATEYMRVVFGGYEKLSNSGVETQVVNVNLSWKASATWDDVIGIGFSKAKLGNTSFTLDFQMVNYHTSVVLLEGSVTYVLVDLAQGGKQLLTDFVKDSLTRGGRGLISNQSGLEISSTAS